MREAAILSELRAALRRQGVLGAAAERLMRDWNEHARDDAARRVEQGAAPAAAQEAAWNALGAPDVLAASAARELAKGSWLGRHPWLGGLALPALAWVFVAAAILVAPAPLIGLAFRHADLGHVNLTNLSAALTCWQDAFNWLPWLFSIGWLARIALRMPGGWKLFWVTAIALIFFSTSLQMMFVPPMHGPHSGSVNFYPTGIFGIIGNLFCRVFGYGSFAGRWSVLWQSAQVGPWIQTGIMLLGAGLFYRGAKRKAPNAALFG
jgi:hypothetical protein